MGENTKVKEQQSTAEALREQIRHTEGDITETVHTLEQRLSPGYLGRRGVRNAQRIAWQGTATLLDLAQRPSVQASLVGGSVLLPLLLIFKNRRASNQSTAKKHAAHTAPTEHRVGTVAKAAGATSLWMLLRKSKDREERPAGKTPLSSAVLAATAAKAFLSSVRSSKKSGTTRPGKKIAWRGLASAIGAALGSSWVGH